MQNLSSIFGKPKEIFSGIVQTQHKKEILKNQKEQFDPLKFIRLQCKPNSTSQAKGKAFIETDRLFVETIEKISNGQNGALKLLTENNITITDDQCQTLNQIAQLHYQANIVNSNTDNKLQDLDSEDICQCGCQRGKGKPLSLLTGNQQLSVLGSGIVLFFSFNRNFVWILLSTVLIYGIYALATNLLGDTAVSDQQCQDGYCHFRSKASSQNKYDPSNLDYAQGWIGVGFCILWIILLRFIKYFGRIDNEQIDEVLNSSSDYAILIKNLPSGQYEQKDLIEYIEKLYENTQLINEKKQLQLQRSSSKLEIKSHSPFKRQQQGYNIKSIHIIYNMQNIRKIIINIFEMSIEIEDYIEKQDKQQLIKTNSLNQSPKKQKKQYLIQANELTQYLNLKEKICQKYQELVKLRKDFFYNTDGYRLKNSTTAALIQFVHPSQKNEFLKLYGHKNVGILKSLQQSIKSAFSDSQKKVIFKQKYNLKILRAPQPSDLLYTNCQKQFSLRRILLIYLLTFLIILISFAIMTGLIYVQDMIINHGTSSTTSKTQSSANNDTTITVLNIIISVVLQIINALLWVSLDIILNLEYNHTLTQKVISQMNKSLFATSLNIILLPIISNYILRSNVYGSNGLAGIVFDYQISVLGIGMAVKLIDPKNLLKRIALKIKYTRNFLIRFTCQKLTDQNIDQQKGVSEVNTLYEGGYFDIAQSYVYIMAATYHAAFFCQLQPFVLFLVTMVVFVFYWVNKFKILRTCKIPELTEMLIFETALSQAALVPVIYGVGSIVISYISAKQHPNLTFYYASGIVSMCVGLIGFFNPGDFLNKIVLALMSCFNISSKQTKISPAEQEITKHEFNANSQVKQEIKAEKKQQMLNRMDNYFKMSNSLSLLGFEQILCGSTSSNIICNHFQQFCQGFIKESKLQRSVFRSLIQHEDKKIPNIHKLFKKQTKKLKQLNQTKKRQLQQKIRKQNQAFASSLGYKE